MAGRFERRMAIAQEDTAVLDFVDAQQSYPALENDLARLPWVPGSTVKEIKRHEAELRYWQRDYKSLVDIAGAAPAQNGDAGSADPELLLLAANASFREAQRGPQDKTTVIRNLDSVIHSYAEALRAGVNRADAAFNYELAVRLRAEFANGKRKAMPLNGADADVEADPNMHGDPGEPPKDMKVNQFQIRVPMDPKDFRKSQDDTAGTGQARRRRG
jgi:hypothetical protein